MASHPDLRRSRTALVAGLALALLSIPVSSSRPARAELTFEVVKSFELPERGPGPLVLGSDGALYGITLRGGSADAGTIFRIASDGTHTRLHSFNPTDGSSPSWCQPAGSGCDSRSPLVLGSDGALYGTSHGAGSFNRGSVFRIDNAGNFTLLHSFNGTDGAYPYAALALGSDGALYGTTTYGGSLGRGTIFRIDSAGNFTLLHSFSGARPSGALAVGQDGALYGTALGGRECCSPPGVDVSYAGEVFRIDEDGTFSRLHSFEDIDDYALLSGLTVGGDGALYGTTTSTHFGTIHSRLGDGNAGTVFKIDNAGNFTLLHSFNGTDGAYPHAGLVLGSDGALYGTTTWDGAFNPGSIFRIDSAGNFTKLSASTTASSFVLGSDGAVYGTTGGTIFRIDSAGNVTTVHSFPPYSSGPYYAFGPSRSLVVGSDGALYGTTPTDWGEPPFWDPFNYFASTHGVNGTVFRIDSTGNFSTLHEFGSPSGYHPMPVLAVDGDGAVYGLTYEGGALDGSTLFQVDRAGNFSALHDFSEDSSSLPYYYPPPRVMPAVLARGGDGAVYGLKQYGSESGRLFKVDSSGSFNFLDFGGGSSSLVLGSDGTLYGSGPSVFQIDSAGVFTSLVESFFDPQRCEALGLNPGGSYSGPVARGSDGLVYGINTQLCWYDAGEGGSGYFGVDAIFRRDASGMITFLHSFPDYSYSALPSTALVMGSDAALYGTRVGQNGSSVFRVDSAGNVTTVLSLPYHWFSPYFPLVLGSDGALYGTSNDLQGNGAVFKIDGAANFSTVHSFSPARFDGVYSADGAYPSGPLVLANNGSLYGTTLYGGAANSGTLFKLDRAGTFTSLHSYTESPIGDWHLVVAGEDCALYGVGRGGPAGGGVLYRLFEPGHLCQQLDFEALPDRTLGDSPFPVTATSSSGLPVTITAEGSCTLSGDQVTLIGVGLCTVTASQAGDADYEPAPEVSQSFDVLFDFTGFLRPVMNPPIVNRVKAGRTVPIRFSLGGDQGRDVLVEGSPGVRPVPCDATAPVNEIEGLATKRSGSLRSVSKRDRYTYLWKTDLSWTGTCQELALELIDGSAHRATFRFER